MSLNQASSRRPLISVLIKALNEEERIAACLDSVLAATGALHAEVLLVDSLSNDRTVEIASQYPIRIVQFAHMADRGCGAAVQLGYQMAHGDFIYVLDADMQIAPGFLPLALKALEEDKGLAGVGGRLIDQAVRTQADVRRARQAADQQSDVEVHELGGGGLYRRAAVEQVGYLANRWLSAYEEADLGARLRAAGWRLKRLHTVAVSHTGHNEGNWSMLLRLWRNGRARATGSFLRAAWRQPWWPMALRKQKHVLLVLAVWLLGLSVAVLSWTVSGVNWISALLLGLVAPALLLAALSMKSKSLASGMWNFLVWHVFAVAAAIGVFDKLPDPAIKIPVRNIQ